MFSKYLLNKVQKNFTVLIESMLVLTGDYRYQNNNSYERPFLIIKNNLNEALFQKCSVDDTCTKYTQK